MLTNCHSWKDVGMYGHKCKHSGRVWHFMHDNVHLWCKVNIICKTDHNSFNHWEILQNTVSGHVINSGMVSYKRLCLPLGHTFAASSLSHARGEASVVCCFELNNHPLCIWPTSLNDVQCEGAAFVPVCPNSSMSRLRWVCLVKKL